MFVLVGEGGSGVALQILIGLLLNFINIAERQSFSATSSRWSEKYRCIRIFKANFKLILVALSSLMGDASSKTRAKALSLKVVFFPGKAGREIYRKFGIFEFPISREIYVGIPGNFFTLARISVVLISIIPT